MEVGASSATLRTGLYAVERHRALGGPALRVTIPGAGCTRARLGNAKRILAKCQHKDHLAYRRP